MKRRAASSSAYLISLPCLPASHERKLTLISIGLSFFTAVADLASGCLEGDVARDGIERPDPFPEGFMVRCAVGVENEDESLGPAPCVEPN